MKKMNIGNGKITASSIALGCFRMHTLTVKEAAALIRTALEQGVDFFDHADIYGDGACEEIFAEAIGMKADIRDRILLQSKCGIRPASYDFSREHILSSVDGSLRRLKTDYLDVLLLHRPDALMEPEEVAETFAVLQDRGKVRHFGVSNHNPMQIELLEKYLGQKLIINQLQFGVMHTGMIDTGLNVNMKNSCAADRDGSVLDYCRLKDITIQAWSPFQYGFFEGAYLDNEQFPELNRQINKLAAEKGVPNTAVAAAWILRHPAGIQAIAGTTNPSRLKDICLASEIGLTRQEWYDIYLSAGNVLP